MMNSHLCTNLRFFNFLIGLQKCEEKKDPLRKPTVQWQRNPLLEGWATGSPWRCSSKNNKEPTKPERTQGSHSCSRVYMHPGNSEKVAGGEGILASPHILSCLGSWISPSSPLFSPFFLLSHFSLLIPTPHLLC